MDVDRLLHNKKHFAELEDSDVEMFLRERKFRSEHLNMEFKNAFPQKPGVDLNCSSNLEGWISSI